MSSATQSLLVTHELTKSVRDGTDTHVIVDHVSFEMAPGERVALVGPSGSGKSTLLQILGALDPDYSGSVRIADQPLEDMRETQRARFRNRTVGFVFQAYNLLGHLTALENVMLPARFGGASRNCARALALIDRVGMAGKGHRKPHALSGGERQRVAIARALYQAPKLVLCDEPTGNLDRATARDVLRLFEQLTAEGVALLVATHDESIASSADRVLHLNEGALV